jgi:hypothetical protein
VKGILERLFKPKGRALAPAQPYTDLASESRVRVYEQARHVVFNKYRRTVKVGDDNVKAGVKLQDCLLVAYFWHAFEFMQNASVDDVEKLTGRDKAILGMMAIAFDLSDAAFEDVCKKLTPNQLEKARIFRKKWIDAGAMQAQMQANRRKVMGEAGELRSAQEKAFAVLHRGLDAAAAYEAGRRQLKSGQPLCGPGETFYFLLPYGVQRARAAIAGAPAVWADAPAYDALSHDERTIVGHMHLCLAHADDTGVLMELMVSRTQVDTVTRLLASLAIPASGHPIQSGDLPQGKGASNGHWPPDAAVPAFWPSLFDAAMIFHMYWNAPIPENPEEPEDLDEPEAQV